MEQNGRSGLATDEYLDICISLKMLDETLYSSLRSKDRSNGDCSDTNGDPNDSIDIYIYTYIIHINMYVCIYMYI
jgi:hypothetical protein